MWTQVSETITELFFLLKMVYLSSFCISNKQPFSPQPHDHSFFIQYLHLYYLIPNVGGLTGLAVGEESGQRVTQHLHQLPPHLGHTLRQLLGLVYLITGA